MLRLCNSFSAESARTTPDRCHAASRANSDPSGVTNAGVEKPPVEFATR